MPNSWKDHFDERELKGIEFCIDYVRVTNSVFNTVDRTTTMRTIIAKMAELLDKAEVVVQEDAKAKKHGDELERIEYALVDNPFKEEAKPEGPEKVEIPADWFEKMAGIKV